jgi:hypothetical protein
MAEDTSALLEHLRKDMQGKPVLTPPPSSR